MYFRMACFASCSKGSYLWNNYSAVSNKERKCHHLNMEIFSIKAIRHSENNRILAPSSPSLQPHLLLHIWSLRMLPEGLKSCQSEHLKLNSIPSLFLFSDDWSLTVAVLRWMVPKPTFLRLLVLTVSNSMHLDDLSFRVNSIVNHFNYNLHLASVTLQAI